MKYEFELGTLIDSTGVNIFKMATMMQEKEDIGNLWRTVSRNAKLQAASGLYKTSRNVNSGVKI